MVLMMTQLPFREYDAVNLWFTTSHAEYTYWKSVPAEPAKLPPNLPAGAENLSWDEVQKLMAEILKPPPRE